MSDTTLAEVAQGAIDHVANGVQQIAGAMEKLAPGAWQIAVQRQRVEGWMDVGFGVGLLALALGACVAIWRMSSTWKDSEDRGMATFGTAVCVAAATIALFTAIRPGLIQALTPEYAAAQAIVATLHGR